MVRGKTSRKCLTVQNNLGKGGCYPVEMETCRDKPEQQFLQGTHGELVNPNRNTTISPLSIESHNFKESYKIVSC